MFSINVRVYICSFIVQTPQDTKFRVRKKKNKPTQFLDVIKIEPGFKTILEIAQGSRT